MPINLYCVQSDTELTVSIAPVSTTRRVKRAAGFTLIELVMFIAIMGIAVAGVLLAYDYVARDSADPVVKKQALAIAESLLQEVQQMPFTYCDPDDPAVSTATGSGDCATPEATGPETGETRYHLDTPFDNVNDYDGFTMNPIRDITNTAIAGLDAYTASVTVAVLADNALPGITGGNALMITVSVSGPARITVNLNAYRNRYAPNI